MENPESGSQNIVMKKGGRYSKKATRLRRERVAELHFEKGYTVVDISRMLDVNRNTITNDIRHCYSKLQQEYSGFNIETSFMVQRSRMETQRNRLVDLLGKQLDFKQRLTLEKIISDIDNKMIQAIAKIATTPDEVSKRAILIFNLWAKNQQPTFRGIMNQSLSRVSVEAHEKISKIMEDDKKKTRGYSSAYYKL